MSEKTSPTPNDQRSNVKNPNNPAHDADQRNRQQQQPGGGKPQVPTKTGR